VSDYDRTREDVEAGMGGRWISVRYEAKSGIAVDRVAIVSEIVGAFTTDGWTQEKLPTHQYVMSEIYETGADDLYFRRSARNDEPTSWQLANAIHVSTDGRVICTYCEVSW
jgi:hypothetical protein